MSDQPYYVPESSKLPFAMALTMLVFIIGAANTVIDLGTDSNSYLILVLSFAMMWTTMYFWFKQVIQENHAGLNKSGRVKVLNNGMNSADVSGIGADHINDICLNEIQQIEVVRGPASPLFTYRPSGQWNIAL